MPMGQSVVDQILSSVAAIRHRAVHRGLKDTHFLSHCLQIAKMFAELHRDTDMAGAVSELSKACQLIFDEGFSKQEELKANLEKRLREIAEERRKLEEKEIGTYGRQWEKWRNQAGCKIGNLLPQITTIAGSQTNKEDQSVEDGSDPEIEGNFIKGTDTFVKDTTARPPSAESEPTRTFPQQGTWQLQQHSVARSFMCTRCSSLNHSRYVACDIVKRDMPLCNKCYGQLLAASRKVSSAPL